ncbi:MULTISPECIES: hypothetical protein [unclassified Bosea (in: a-proteobacteria)]|uniref:Cap15 family cyclic dinucleotide receptor domain-containing protein n=1 Tax=unclassified Bosea (in: a-proteobacteria) TaxID=2653178 RepID=UPI000F759F0D|nr:MULTISPECIES: hypothetical protein [unclassified Bosea (in: a-proteobacteria)]AZO77228.1 hypothetical protein BLM15_06100 [Bosea sp. Tri-49]RXT22080.1 hypothetical protein B5U98_16755 [Bosea sp. Tri-39]RXT32422.1 hypothetical protein B5U99_27600 [Bosea sp. Tri-54]
MWGLLGWRAQASFLVFASALLSWAIHALDGLFRSELGPLDVAGLSVTVLVSVGAVLASLSWRWLWEHCPVLERVVFPDLNGEWSGTVESTWSPDTATPRPDPIHVTIIITQGLFETHVSAETLRAESESTRCIVERTKGGRARLWYSYETKARLTHADGNPPHTGVAWLEMAVDKDRERLVGGYFTDRKSTGDIEIRRTQAL